MFVAKITLLVYGRRLMPVLALSGGRADLVGTLAEADPQATILVVHRVPFTGGCELARIARAGAEMLVGRRLWVDRPILA